MSTELRNEPAAVRVLLTSGEGVEIDWKDGHRSRYTFAFLRERCPCATCNDLRERAPAGPALPLYKPTPRAVGAQPVGNYAVQFKFNDGHSTGIYSFPYFRSICPCQECSPKGAHQ